MLLTSCQPPETTSRTENGHVNAAAIIVIRATCRLQEHPHFRGRTSTVELEFDQGTMILTGRLPSFYLKQLLQEALRDIDGVEVIDNRVDVVCPNGLSSRRW
ncbi:MAG: BON domain-containing protein [Candidatus Nealsonbacteria bacterium]|nr:BON domain-containing protein [Candidatus Nealsonbacteria bacterium]